MVTPSEKNMMTFSQGPEPFLKFRVPKNRFWNLFFLNLGFPGTGYGTLSSNLGFPRTGSGTLF
jgi:hypothetical protein